MFSYTLKDKILWHITTRSGVALIGVVVAVAALAVVMIPITKWYLSVNARSADFENRLEMQSIVQDYWNQMNLSTYNEFQAAITVAGTTWTEDIGGKYELTIVFSEDGKYENALCNIGVAAGADERHCRNVDISLVSKENSLSREVLHTTRVSLPGESAGLEELKDRIKTNEERFSQYYKKMESDTRYVQKGAHS